jgi:hypothetical protein
LIMFGSALLAGVTGFAATQEGVIVLPEWVLNNLAAAADPRFMATGGHTTPPTLLAFLEELFSAFYSTDDGLPTNRCLVTYQQIKAELAQSPD